MATLKTVRWTITEAAPEFNLTRKTLSERIKSKGIEPGRDNKFSTRDICLAVFSDLENEKTQLTMEQKELTRIRKLQLARKLCVLETVQGVWHSALAEIRQRVSNWAVEDDLKQQLLKELRDIPTDDYFPKDAPSPEIGDEEDL
jgi:hypothetical protein